MYCTEKELWTIKVWLYFSEILQKEKGQQSKKHISHRSSLLDNLSSLFVQS